MDMLNTRRIILIIIILLPCQPVYSFTGLDLQRLFDDLFNGTSERPNTLFVPSKNLSEKFLVNYGVLITSITSLEELKGKLLSTVVIFSWWTDEYFTWDPSTYNGIDTISIPKEFIWTPNIFILNGRIKNTFYEGAEIINFGYVTVTQLFEIESWCDIKIDRYPFDIQNCNIIFETMDRFIDMKLHAKLLLQGGWKSNGNGEWNVTNTTVKEKTLTLRMSRRPTYVLLNIIVPAVMLAFLSIFAFLFPVTSGEKMSYSITVFLSFTVFQSAIASQLPSDGYRSPYLGIYIAEQLALSSVIVMICAIELRLSLNSTERPIPKVVKSLVLIFLKSSSHVQTKRKISHSDEKIKQREHVSCETDEGGNDLHNSELQNDECGQKDEQKSEIKRRVSENSNDVITWTDVCCFLDKCFFILFGICLVISTTLFFILILP